MYSELISASIASGGPHAAKTSQVKLMRSCKKVALRLIETFVEKCDDSALVAQQIVPAMMDPILGDYARNVPDARWASGFLHRMNMGSVWDILWVSGQCGAAVGFWVSLYMQECCSRFAWAFWVFKRSRPMLPYTLCICAFLRGSVLFALQYNSLHTQQHVMSSLFRPCSSSRASVAPQGRRGAESLRGDH